MSHVLSATKFYPALNIARDIDFKIVSTPYTVKDGSPRREASIQRLGLSPALAVRVGWMESHLDELSLPPPLSYTSDAALTIHLLQ
jgi:hypothetical protein